MDSYPQPHKQIETKNGITVERNFRGFQRGRGVPSDAQSVVSGKSIEPRVEYAPDAQIQFDGPEDHRRVVDAQENTAVTTEPVRAPAPESVQLPEPEPVQPQDSRIVQQSAPAPLAQERRRSNSTDSRLSTISKHIPPSTLDRLTGNEAQESQFSLKTLWKWALAVGAGIIIGNQFLPQVQSGSIGGENLLSSHPLTSALRY